VTDYSRGMRHAAEVIEYARNTSQPQFVDCVVVWMTYLLYDRCGFLDPSAMLERGFIDRVRIDAPDVLDRIAVLIYSQHPDRRH
jgi:hypothetical protein